MCRVIFVICSGNLWSSKLCLYQILTALLRLLFLFLFFWINSSLILSKSESQTSFTRPFCNKPSYFGLASEYFNFSSWGKSSERSDTPLSGFSERSYSVDTHRFDEVSKTLRMYFSSLLLLLLDGRCWIAMHSLIFPCFHNLNHLSMLTLLMLLEGLGENFCNSKLGNKITLVWGTIKRPNIY